MIECIATSNDRYRRIAFFKYLAQFPIVLYGAGFYAKEITDFLSSINIRVAQYVVDYEYIDLCTNNKIKPISITEIDKIYNSINIIIAFTKNSHKAIQKIINYRLESVRSIQEIDCRFWKCFRSLTPQYISDNKKKFSIVFEWLQDDISKLTYLEYINSKLLYDSTILRSYKTKKQYFPEDIPHFFPSNSEIFVDCGAYIGDTLDEFISIFQHNKNFLYYAFEPEPANLNKLKNKVNGNLESVNIISKGLWSHADTLKFQCNDGSRSCLNNAGDGMIEVDALDNYNIPATYIKMDIEGSEYHALKGASKTIRNFKPNLAIAVYHKPSDLIMIPALIKELCSDYRLYLRAHSYNSEEVVLYATIKN